MFIWAIALFKNWQTHWNFVSIDVEDTDYDDDGDDKEPRNNDAGKFLLAVIIIGIS